jgi:hypothetical protein
MWAFVIAKSNIKVLINHADRYSSVTTVTGYGNDDQSSILGRVRGFSLSVASRPAPRPTQSPVQWTPGVLSQGVKLRTHLYLVPSSEMGGYIPPRH